MGVRSPHRRVNLNFILGNGGWRGTPPPPGPLKSADLPGKNILDAHVHLVYILCMAHEPKTLQEAIAYFSDPERAFQYAVKMRFPDGRIYCPRCGAEKFSFIKTRRIWFCYACKKQFTVKVKTIMEDSALGLDKWMVAIWMLANCKNGISSHELARSLGITQKSAWFMLQRIREALKERSFGGTKLGGSGSEVEADETFVGGKASNMHTGRRKAQEAKGPLMNKTIVQGMYDRELRKVRCTVIPNVRRDTLQNMLLKNIKYGSTVYTDNAVGYDKVSYNFVHDVINHTQEYVRGRVHTNSIENFWSLLKRFPAIRRGRLNTLQVNVGYRCNQSCFHCHVNAGPNRSEEMSADVADTVLAFIERRAIKTLDITGGAPELNAHFRRLVSEARRLGVKVMDR